MYLVVEEAHQCVILQKESGDSEDPRVFNGLTSSGTCSPLSRQWFFIRACDPWRPLALGNVICSYLFDLFRVDHSFCSPASGVNGAYHCRLE